MKSVNNNLTDIPEPFCRNIQDHIDEKKKEFNARSEEVPAIESMEKTMKTKQNDMLFLLLIMIIFYDNRF